jgi:hypothetical protein
MLRRYEIPRSAYWIPAFERAAFIVVATLEAAIQQTKTQCF